MGEQDGIQIFLRDKNSRKSSATIFSVSDKFLYIAELPKSSHDLVVGRLQQETYESLKCPPKLGYISMGGSSTPSLFLSASDKKLKLCEGTGGKVHTTVSLFCSDVLR